MCHNKPFLLDSQWKPKVGGAFEFLLVDVPRRSGCWLVRDFRDNLLTSLIKNKIFAWICARQSRQSLFRLLHVTCRLDPNEAAVTLPFQYVQMGCAHNPRSPVDWLPYLLELHARCQFTLPHEMLRLAGVVGRFRTRARANAVARKAKAPPSRSYFLPIPSIP